MMIGVVVQKGFNTVVKRADAEGMARRWRPFYNVRATQNGQIKTDNHRNTEVVLVTD